MSYRTTLDAKIPSSLVPAVFDFAQSLALGETLTTVSTTATVYSGADATPSAVLSGSPTVSAKQVIQNLTGGVLGVVYYIVCAATTSLGKVLLAGAYLSVTAGN
ncbi:MAG: hypothetical protein JZU60_02740 [Ilumatobacteraceae bacterium]|nr:hypothetical protein [Ilumatobacteraceae bacterium]